MIAGGAAVAAERHRLELREGDVGLAQVHQGGGIDVEIVDGGVVLVEDQRVDAAGALVVYAGAIGVAVETFHRINGDHVVAIAEVDINEVKSGESILNCGRGAPVDGVGDVEQPRAAGEAGIGDDRDRDVVVPREPADVHESADRIVGGELLDRAVDGV